MRLVTQGFYLTWFHLPCTSTYRLSQLSKIFNCYMLWAKPSTVQKLLPLVTILSTSHMGYHMHASPPLFCNTVNLTTSPTLLHPLKFSTVASGAPSLSSVILRTSSTSSLKILYTCCSKWNLVLAFIHFLLLHPQVQTYFVLYSLWSL